uniref:NADH-ubiquinone oxidoreductase chain 6 n=1 Tax=Onthophagus falculatus TaxID=1848555 RepID=A0A1X9HDI7_9SCAR|nr:NADH deshydrogenase subunit 6 [Onthophagus falculatus]
MIMLMIMMLCSLFIISIKHPLTMGAILLIQTINMSLYMGYLNLNYWYSYILFLIMIGGMLILFIYMTSIASNEKFSPSIKLFMMFNLIIMIYFFMYFIDPFYFNLTSNFKEQIHNLSLNKFYNFPNSFIMYLLIIYLLITLFAVIEISSFKKGSLRMTNFN